MRTTKTLSVLLIVMLSARWSNANNHVQHEQHPVPIVVTNAQGAPRTSSIQATINGHALSVTFTENLGTVHVEVTDPDGGPVDMTDLHTPDGYYAYIHYARSYAVTITLDNGDEYYGEFEVTD